MTHRRRFPAAALEERAAYWLMRREEPDWSSDEQAAFDAWLAESMAHKAAFWRLEHGWRQADRIAALGRPRAQGLPQRRPPWRRTWAGLAVAASVLAAVILIGAPFFPVRSADPVVHERFSTPVGGYQSIVLEDGSRIELNTATALRVAISNERREAWLDQGEVYFEVLHAKERPFVVHAGSRALTVLGTKFSVRIDPDRTVFGVVEGRVRIDEMQARKPVRSTVIISGDLAIAQGDATRVLANAVDRVASSLSWRDGMIILDGATLAEAAAEFNRYSDRKIVVTDPQTRSVRIGGTFRTSSIDAFVDLLRDAYGFQVAIQDSDVIVSR